MRRSTSTTPVRNGFTPTLRTASSEPGVTAARTRKKAADEMSPGTTRSTGSSRPAGCTVTEGPLPRERGPHRGQHPLRVVPRRKRLHHGHRGIGVQPRQQQGRLDLRGRHRHLVADPLQGPAPDAEGREPVPFPAPDRRAHPRQRTDHAGHGAAAQVRVPGDDGEERLGRQKAGPDTDRGAGIPGVDHVRRARKNPSSPPRRSAVPWETPVRRGSRGPASSRRCGSCPPRRGIRAPGSPRPPGRRTGPPGG